MPALKINVNDYDIKLGNGDALWQINWRMPRWSNMLLPLFITLVIVFPILVLTMEILNPDLALWERLWTGILPRVISNTLLLVLGVGAGTFLIGTGFAWLVTAYEFPGRRWFEHLLLLPLAIPGFIMGFIFVSIFEYAGPVQTALRDTFGSSAWFPNISSPGGLILVLTLVLYPYVYILARAAFREQAASTYEAAQVMGYNRTQTFFKLVLPLARPSIAAGTILAMMEAMTDYGAVSFFGFPTLSERIVVLWNTEFQFGPAAELASLLLIFALVMIFIERHLRGKAKYYQQGGKGRRPQRIQLAGWKKWSATAACSSLIGFAFALPMVRLIAWAINEYRYPSVGAWQEVYFEYIGNTVLLASTAAAIVILLALVMAYQSRVTSFTGKRRFQRIMSRMVTLGYAMPGSMVAMGVLLVVSPVDGEITRFAENHLGWNSAAYILTGTITALSYAYIVRFMSVGFNSVESSMEKVTPNMECAARTLGAKPARVMWKIHMPLVSTGMAAGAILVFVDVMKELPATLLLRPFGMDTLALWSYFLGMESFWQATAIPALTIIVVGLIPVFLLMKIGDGQSVGDH